MAKGFGQLEASDFGQEQQGTYGDDMPSVNHFLLFVPLQAKEWCLLPQSDVLQRFVLYKRISVDSSTTLVQRFMVGNLLSFESEEEGAVTSTNYRPVEFQQGYIYSKKHFRKGGHVPVKTCPAYVEAIMSAQIEGTSGSAKIFNVNFVSFHDADFWVTYDGKVIPRDLSSRDLIDYNMPVSSFLVRDLLIKSYNAMMHKTTVNYSYILFGEVT